MEKTLWTLKQKCAFSSVMTDDFFEFFFSWWENFWLVRMLPFSMTRTFMLDRLQRSSVNMKQKFNSCGRVLSQTIRTRGLPRQILTQLHAYLCLTLTFLSPQQMDAYGTSQVVTLCKRNTSCTSKHTHEGENKIFLFLFFFI